MRTHIGTFMQDTRGFMHGRIYGLGLGVTSVIFEPQTDKNGRVTYFKLIADPVGEAYEVGRAWQKEKDGKIYHSVILESPVFDSPLNVALFPDRDNLSVFNLVMERENRDPEAGTNTKVRVMNRPPVMGVTL